MSKPSSLRNERPFKFSVNHRKESTVGEPDRRKRKPDGRKSRALPGSLNRTRQGD
ncbi:MAG: hypothetical protein H0T42_21365 [Deltaproteobacteria bacterium]|nr:hypothetical protein [Deltaproteobacteria bacterium]